MKKEGLIVFAIGLAFAAITSFNFMTREKVVDLGNVEITQNRSHYLTWSPLLGVAVMILGGSMYVFGAKNQKI